MDLVWMRTKSFWMTLEDFVFAFVFPYERVYSRAVVSLRDAGGGD